MSAQWPVPSRFAGHRAQGTRHEAMLDIKNLHAGIDGKEILHGVDLHVGTGVAELAGEDGGLVSRDPAGDAEEDSPPRQRRPT